jgi:hypothetical protein
VLVAAYVGRRFNRRQAKTWKGQKVMKPLLAALAILVAVPAAAAPPTPMAFESIVDEDSFRITNKSPSATIIEVAIFPKSVNVGSFVESDPQDMDVSRMTSRPEEDFSWWISVGSWNRDRWTEWQWTQAPAEIAVVFSEFHPTGYPFHQLGILRVPLETGLFEGMIVPEPATWTLVVLGLVACCVAWLRRKGTVVD